MPSRVNNHQLCGHIFVCTDKTKDESIKRALFGSSKSYGSSVLKIEKGDILFLNNVDNDTLYGVFRAASVGALNIQPEAWSGKFPYQVQVELPINIQQIKGAKNKLKKLRYGNQVILAGEKLAYILDFFAYQTNSLSDLLIKRNTNNSETKEQLNNKRNVPLLEPTTLWDFTRQSYGDTKKGDNGYSGVTPALVIYNLVWQYTKPGELVVDPMCGSGTTIDVCNSEKRRVIGYDISSTRSDIIQADARHIPLAGNEAQLIFIDPPYGDNIVYNEHPANIGNISSNTEEYFQEIEKVMREAKRVLQSGKIIAWLIGDQSSERSFNAVGFETYKLLCKYFTPVDIICIARRGQSSHTGEWVNRARRLSFYLRGFKYLFIFKKTNNNLVPNVNNE